MYGFTKVHADPQNGEFLHTYFRRGRKDLLFLIFRKGAKPTQNKSHQKRAAKETSKKEKIKPETQEIQTASEPPSLVQRQQSDRVLSSLCDLRVAHQSLINRVKEMEEKQLDLSSQNEELWRKLQESRTSQEVLQEKFQRIVYFMYDMFLSAGGKGE